MIAAVWLALVAVALAVCVVLLIRNERVARYRMAAIQSIHARSYEDIAEGRPWEWRWRAYQAVEYNEMVLRFWRPLDSWFPPETRPW